MDEKLIAEGKRLIQTGKNGTFTRLADTLAARILFNAVGRRPPPQKPAFDAPRAHSIMTLNNKTYKFGELK